MPGSSFFGQATPEVQAELDGIDIHEHVHMLGWTPANEIYRIFWAADFALFPGTHSVLWEEAIGHGLGTVFHHWRGMDHLDIGGNTRIIHDATPETLDRLLADLTADDAAEIKRLGAVAAEKGPRVFLIQRHRGQGYRIDAADADPVRIAPRALRARPAELCVQI